MLRKSSSARNEGLGLEVFGKPVVEYLPAHHCTSPSHITGNPFSEMLELRGIIWTYLDRTSILVFNKDIL